MLQYAERVFELRKGTDDERVDAAIRKTEEFFAAMGNPTRLSAYGLDESIIPVVAEKLELHGHVQLA